MTSKLKVHQDFTRDRAALEQAIADAVKGKDDRRQLAVAHRSRARGHPCGPVCPVATTCARRAARTTTRSASLAEASGTITGRKNLLLFTNGFAGRVNSFGQYQPDQRHYPEMSRALNDNNVAVYPIDLAPAGTEHTLSDFMNELAVDTGGRYFYNFTSFATPLEQIADENSGYYLLSYRSEKPAGAKGFQEVKVKTSNPEFRIRARKGYDYGS